MIENIRETMRVLVTGGTGFVGGHLVSLLIERGYNVIETSFLPNDAAPTKDTVRRTVLDTRDPKACLELIAEFRPETIFHLAGIAFVPEAERDFRQTLLTNVGGTANIFAACREAECKTKIVLISSAEVYGQVPQHELPITENRVVKPLSNYSLSKVMCELVAERYARQYKISTAVMRPFNHIGPGQHENFVVSSFAKQLAEIKLGKKDPVIKVGNLDALRDFTDVRDIVKGYLLAALYGDGVYNLCSSTSISIRSILDKLCELADADVQIEIDKTRLRPSDITEFKGSYSRAMAELGWEPTIALEQSLQDSLTFWIDKLREC